MRKLVGVLTLALMLSLTSCGGGRNEFKISDDVTVGIASSRSYETRKVSLGRTTLDTKCVRVVFETEYLGEFVAELYPQFAPETVKHFLNLVYDGYYDGAEFSRIVPGFVAQTGAKVKKADKVKGEFKSNGYKKNTLKHEKGVISMARKKDKNSAEGEFFICLGEASHLDGEYAAFGKIVYGMNTAEKIGETPGDENDKPLMEVKIKKAYIISEAQYKKY